MTKTIPLPPTTPLAKLSAQTFDPQGDFTENTATVGNALDGAEGSWTTETTYIAPAFGKNKHGVGFVLVTPAPTIADYIEIHTDAPGWQATIYARTDVTEPSSLSQWIPVAKPFSMDSGDQTIRLATAKPMRLYMIWITRLTRINGQYAASISDVRLLSVVRTGKG